MDYPTAVAHTIEALNTVADEHAEQVAIELIRHSWRVLGPQDPAWHLLAVNALNTRDTLYPDRLPIVLTVDAPAADCGSSTRQLLAALVDRYERASQAGGPLTLRLQYAAAAATLRRATAQLP